MNIGSVAEITGLPAKTIRYYEDVGLIGKIIRAENGYRHYAETDVQTLRFIQRARRLGFSVKDVSGLVTLWNDKNRASSEVKATALRQIEEVEKRIAELKSIRNTLLHLTDQCHGDDRPDCPILQDMALEG